MTSLRNLSDKVEDELSAVALKDMSKSLDTIVSAKQVVHESRLVIQLYFM